MKEEEPEENEGEKEEEEEEEEERQAHLSSIISVPYWSAKCSSIPSSPYQPGGGVRGRGGGGVTQFHTHLGIWSSTGASSSCLDAKQVIEESTDKVVMKEQSAGWVEYHKREDGEARSDVWWRTNYQ